MEREAKEPYGWGEVSTNSKIIKFDNFFANRGDKYIKAFFPFVICANDLKICLEGVNCCIGKQPHKANYYFRLTISHLREIAKHLSGNKEIIEEYLNEVNDGVADEAWSELKDNLENFEGLVKDVLKNIRDSSFHYSVKDEEIETIKNLEELEVAVPKEGELKNSPLGQIYLFGHRISGIYLNKPLSKKNVERMSKTASKIFEFIDSVLHCFNVEDQYRKSLVERFYNKKGEK